MKQMLRNSVRWAHEPDNPMVITRWLSMDYCCDSIHQQYCRCSKQRQWAQAESNFCLLLEVVMDDLLPAEWRRQCLDAIYRPLTELHRLVRDEDEKRRLYRLEYDLVDTFVKPFAGSLCGTTSDY